MTNKESIEWPEVFDVPDYSLLVANELVPNIGLPPPDGKRTDMIWTGSGSPAAGPL